MKTFTGIAFAAICFALLIAVAHPIIASAAPSYAAADTVAHISLPDSVAQEFSDTLQDIVIEAELVKHRGMEDIVIVTESMLAGTNNAGELLGKLNGMYFDTAGKDLLYYGSKNIILLVDSIEKDPGYIKQLRPERFDRINIVAYPTGKYAGYDALISLHTKPTYIGYEGFGLAEAGVQPTEYNGKGKHLRQSRINGGFTYTYEKFNFYVFGLWSWGRYGNAVSYTSEYPLNGYKETYSKPDNDPINTIDVASRPAFQIAADYDFNKNHSISVQLEIKPIWSHEVKTFENERVYLESGLTQRFTSHSNIDRKNHIETIAGIWYRGKLKGWNLNASFSYHYTGFDWCLDRTNTIGFNLKDYRRGRADYESGSISANYNTPDYRWYLQFYDDFIFDRFDTWRLGTDEMISSNRDFRNTFEFSSEFRPSNKIGLALAAGVQLFHSNSMGQKYTRVNPQGRLYGSWRPSDNLWLYLSYTLSIKNPSLSQIQDIRYFIDELNCIEGNPMLKSGLDHRAGITLNLFNKVSMRASYNHTSNSIVTYYSPGYGMTSSGVEAPFIIEKSVNGSTDHWNIKAQYNQRFFNNLDFFISGGLGRIKSSFGNDTRSMLYPDINLVCKYMLPRYGVDVQLNAWSDAQPSVLPQSKQWCYADTWKITLTKYLLNNNLSLNLGYILPLNLLGRCSHAEIITEPMIQTGAVNQTRSYYNMLTFTVIYNFSGGKSVRHYNRHSETIVL